MGQNLSPTFVGPDTEDRIQDFIHRIGSNLQNDAPDSLTLPGDNSAAQLLIVDDERGIRLALMRALSLLGYAVDGAGSGQEALALLERTSYDLMVLDMHMPDTDGAEVMHRARRLHPDLLIIVLTGHATLDSAIAAVKLEAVDYLCKPVSIREIAGTIARVLRKQAKQLHQRRLVQLMGRALNALREVETPLTSPPSPTASSERFVVAAPLILDRQNLRVAMGDSPVQIFQLTEGEAEVLASLMTHPNQVLSCRELVHLMWGQNLTESEAESVVRPRICRLRRKFRVRPKADRLICTVRGQGYVFASNEAAILGGDQKLD